MKCLYIYIYIYIRLHQKLSSYMTDKSLTLNDIQYASFVVHVSTDMQSTCKFLSNYSSQ